MIAQRKPKPKKCRECRKEFQPVRAIQPVCDDMDCKVAYATKAAERARAKREAKVKRDLREAKEKAKTRKDYIKDLDKAFSAYIRFRDKDKPCICCGEQLSNGSVGGYFDAGHFVSRRHMATRWDERNVHGQRKYCNRRLGGNPRGYRIGLADRLGQNVVDELEAAAKVDVHIQTADIISAIGSFKQKLKELKELNGACK